MNGQGQQHRPTYLILVFPFLDLVQPIFSTLIMYDPTRDKAVLICHRNHTRL